MFTAQQVDTMLQNINAEAPPKWQAGIQTIILDQAKTIQLMAAEIGRLRKKLDLVALGAAQLAAEVKGGGSEVAPEVAQGGEVVSSAPPPGAPAGAPTVGADGLPLSAEEIEREAQMNAAMGAPVAPQAAPPQAQRQRAPQPQRRPRPQGAPPAQRPHLAPVPGESPGGTPTTPDQDALEAQMNAAAGPRQE